MDNNKTYQLELEGAKFYEKNFVPVIFEKWAKIIIDKLDLMDHDNILDLACGTGIVARVAKKSKAGNLKIKGCDVNSGMLEVAGEIEPAINWVKAEAEDLPFESKSFDKIICQFGLMFFQDQAKALSEMNRVRKANGKIVISIWDKIESNEGYFDLLKIVENAGGSKLGDILRSPFNMGNKIDLKNLLDQNGLTNYKIETIKVQVEFPSIDHWIDCDVKASPIAKIINDQEYSLLINECRIKLAKYSDAVGKIKFNMSAHIITIG